MIKVKNILLLTRKLDSSVNLWVSTLGFSIVHQSDTFAELKDENNFRVCLREMKQEAFLSTGYHPILNLEVPFS